MKKIFKLITLLSGTSLFLISCQPTAKNTPEKQEQIEKVEQRKHGFEKDPGALKGLDTEKRLEINSIQEQSGTIQ